MKIEVHNNLGAPLVVTATRILVTTDDGTPIAFCLELAPGHFRHFRAGDPDFQDQLMAHGILRTVMVKTLKG